MADELQLDTQALERIKTYGGKAVLVELLAIYTRDMPARFERANLALQQHRPAEIAEILHAMRSSAGNLGVTTIVEETRRLEHQAKQEHLQSMAADLAKLEETYRQSVNILEQVKF